MTDGKKYTIKINGKEFTTTDRDGVAVFFANACGGGASVGIYDGDNYVTGFDLCADYEDASPELEIDNYEAGGLPME